MQSLTINRFLAAKRQYASVLSATVLILMTIALSACGGGGASGGTEQAATLSGNWQFTMAPQTDGNSGDPTFNGGLMGGFLLSSNGSIAGQMAYSITSSASATGLPCNAGSAPVTVTLTGQSVTITEIAGSQTFTLTGTLSSNGSTMMGTYTSTAGAASDGSACGYAETGLSWSAVLVPTFTGTITGSFHSTEQGNGLTNQEFAVSGSITQGPNTGASNATVTGEWTFIDPATNLSDYPCFSTAYVNGQISGTSVILQIIGPNGSIWGQVGEPVGSPTGVNPVSFNSVPGGAVLQGVGPSYIVATNACPGSLDNTSDAGDSGNICLGLNSTTACQQPITLTPAAITFPAQTLGTAQTAQTITLTNNSSSTLNNLSLQWSVNPGSFNDAPSDFNGLQNFTHQDTCATPFGSSFSLNAGASCTVTVSFAPQEGCPWLPFPQSGNGQSILGASPEYCPFPLGATLTVNSPASADSDTSFALPVTGFGLSALQPSVPELDFSSEEPSETSSSQTLTFTNIGANPVQILGSAPCLNPQSGQKIGYNTLPRPLTLSSPVAGLQVIANYQPIPVLIPDNSTIDYGCDSDPVDKLPNFQISSDTCTGATLNPQATCSLQIAFVPQAATVTDSGTNGLDAFLELNTVQCTSPEGQPLSPPGCEIDSGRFPVELKANSPSPLRMSPSAGLDFGGQTKGTTSAPQTITLLNDPSLSPAQTVTFVGRISVQGNYAESDNCPALLAPGSACTITVNFTPAGVGFETGQLTIDYTQTSSAGNSTGNPQYVYLRGTGQ
jgi:hypothetical protein